MMTWWTVGVIFLAVVYALANDHVVFNEEPVSTNSSSQEMEELYKTFRMHSHKINGKTVFCYMFQYS